MKKIMLAIAMVCTIQFSSCTPDEDMLVDVEERATLGEQETEELDPNK